MRDFKYLGALFHFCPLGALTLEVCGSPFQWNPLEFNRDARISLFSVEGIKCTPSYDFRRRWAPWKAERKRCSPSAARLSLSDWNFLALKEAHALETKARVCGEV